MRTSRLTLGWALIGCGLLLAAPASAFDGRRTLDGTAVAVPPGAPGLAAAQPLAAVPVPPGSIPGTAMPEGPMQGPGRLAVPDSTLTPLEALRSGARALRAGHTDQAVTALEYAAEQGMAAAQWKLARMYADGLGVDKDKIRAFEYFRRVANMHADDNPAAPHARFVASAFVALGKYYLEGIPNSQVTADPERARDMFAYAASYFGDADAQYQLGRLYLEGVGIAKDTRQAARWLRLAATKGHHQAQALLGSLLFNGGDVARQAAVGLMWLTLARDSARPDEAWINKAYNEAFKQASDDERAMAFNYLKSWMETRRE